MSDNRINFNALGGVALVIFRKKDGTLREMVCTTNLDLVPLGQQPKGTRGAGPPGLIKAYDLNKNEWRSFYDTSVISLQEYRTA